MPTVDYRLARKAMLRAVRAGMVSRIDVCDAHPELIRSARYVGEASGEPCPICEHHDLRLVLYAYGKDLKRSSGRVRRRSEIHELREQVEEFITYVVEVCTECSWNHLLRRVTTGRRYQGGSGIAVG